MKTMTKLRSALLFLPAVLASTTLPAQSEATTLLRLSGRADVVVHARVVALATPAPDWLRVTFEPVQALKGDAGGPFHVTETARRCCGQAMFALQHGDERILFLERVGPALHTLGGGRGVLPALPALLDHVQQLLQAPSTNALGHLLAESLGADDPRIAHDAAHALATLPDLQLDAAERSAVATHLGLAAHAGSTLAAPLADIAARIGDAQMVDAMLPVFLTARRDDQARLLQRALQRCPATLVADRLPLFVDGERRGNVRAAKLLTQLPQGLANRAMNDLLLRRPHPSAQLQLCEGLLAAGVPSAAIAPMVPEVVLQMAVERRRQRPHFRNVRPSR